MNADRRHTVKMIVALLQECSHSGEIDDGTHVAVTDAIVHLQSQEYWQLKNQERHAGKNASTDAQLAICRVALPALEEAVKAWNADDFETTISQLSLAGTTDGTVPKRISKKGLRSTRK